LLDDHVPGVEALQQTMDTTPAEILVVYQKTETRKDDTNREK
jgi:hypothetical protein